MIPTGTINEMEYAVWQNEMRADRDNEGNFEYYRCSGSGEVWVRGRSGSHLAFVVRKPAPITLRKESKPEKVDGRGKQCGEASGRSKLTGKQVLGIRELYDAGGVSYETLAEAFDVHYSNIANIVNRKIWPHI